MKENEREKGIIDKEKEDFKETKEKGITYDKIFSPESNN